MAININNQQNSLNKLVNALETGHESVARLELNKLKKQAANRRAYLERLVNSDKYSGAERQVLQSELNAARESEKTVSEAVDVVRKGLKDPQHVRYNAALNRLNVQQFKVNARKAQQRHLQSAAKGAGASIISQKAGLKTEALLTNMLYENELYNLDREKVEHYNSVFLKYLGYDLKRALYDIVNTSHRINSDDFHEGILAIAADIQARRRTDTFNKLSAEQKAELNTELRNFINDMRSAAI